jgi:NitT/TauT family transport system permease protein
MRWSKRLLGLGLFFLLWQAFAASGLVPPEYFPGVPVVARALADLAATRDFWTGLAMSCARVAAGLGLAILFGLGLALLTARAALLRRMLNPLVEILRVLPPPALVPMAIYALGLGPRMFLFIIVNAAIWPIYINAANALAATEPIQVLTGRAYGYSPGEILYRLQLPAALPEIFTGIRIAAGFALLATVAAEMLAGTDGIGYQLYNAGFSLDTPQMFALMFVIGVLGVVIQATTALARRLFVTWHAALASLAEPA